MSVHLASNCWSAQTLEDGQEHLLAASSGNEHMLRDLKQQLEASSHYLSLLQKSFFEANRLCQAAQAELDQLEKPEPAPSLKAYLWFCASGTTCQPSGHCDRG